MRLTVVKMEFPHFNNTTITMWKYSRSEFSVEIENDNKRYEHYIELSYGQAKEIVETEIKSFAEKLNVN